MDYKETPEALRAFATESGLTLTTPLDRDGRVTERYLVRGFPTAFVIDKSGRVRDKTIGALDYDAVKARIDPLLTE